MRGCGVGCGRCLGGRLAMPARAVVRRCSDERGAKVASRPLKRALLLPHACARVCAAICKLEQEPDASKPTGRGFNCPGSTNP